MSPIRIKAEYKLQSHNPVFFLPQMIAIATQKKLREVPEEVVRLMHPEYMKRAQSYADAFFYSMYRLLQQSQPDFEK